MSTKKRSLILAGGGIKVAFQAGVLQVWLDEAGLTFDHADGASGGVFNLAMYCQGLTGTQIADNWRKTVPELGLDFNIDEYAKLVYGNSIFTLDKFRENVFTGWGLDWNKIRATSAEATFNVYNFSKHELEVLTPAQMSEDFLVACVSLPMWFPAQTINNNIYIDPVYITDANIEEALQRGADELWIIWTVSEKSEWHSGFVAQYFQTIETAANGHFRRIIKRIEANNAALAAGGTGEFGRPIDLNILRAEVPLHYLINLSADRLNEAVNQGVEVARRWCAEQGIPLQGGITTSTSSVPPADDPTTLEFTEEMKGYLTLGETDYDRGFRTGRAAKTFCIFHLTIKIDGVNRFIRDPRHDGTAEGYVDCAALGGRLPVEQGFFNLFVDAGDPDQRKMLYRLFLRDPKGQALTLSGFKEVKDDPGFDVWSDTSTLYTRILSGHVSAEDEANAMVIATGIINIYQLDFLKQLTTFRSTAPTLGGRVDVMRRFGALFMGKLWDVYADRVLSSGPF